MGLSSARLVKGTAAANVALHVAGLVAAGTLLQPGTALQPLEARLAYLSDRPLGWAVGWSLWMLCALALVAFLAVVAREAAGDGWATPALALGTAGAAVDVLCETLWIVVVPHLAARAAGDAALFLAVERGLTAGGVVVANGFYSLAVPLMSFSVPRLSRAAVGLGLATGASGLALAVAGFSPDPRLAVLAMVPTFGAFLAWTLVVARDLTRGA